MKGGKASAAPTIGTSPGVSSYTERTAVYTTYVDPKLIKTELAKA